MSTTYGQWIRSVDFIEGKRTIINAIGDSLTSKIPEVDEMLLKRNEQHYEWANNEIKRSILILKDTQNLPQLIVISDNMTKKQKKEALSENEKIEILKNQYTAKKIDALFRLCIPELRRYLKNYSNELTPLIKNNFGYRCKQCVTVLGELNIQNEDIDSVMKSPHASDVLR